MICFHGGYHVSTLFDTAQDLKVGNSVKTAGVEIGRVEKIRIATNDKQGAGAMKLRSDAAVKTDSKPSSNSPAVMGKILWRSTSDRPEARPAVDEQCFRPRNSPI